MDSKKGDHGVSMCNFKVSYLVTFAVFWVMVILLVIRHPDIDIWLIGTANVMLALSLDFKNRLEHQKLNDRLRQLEQDKQM